MSVANRLACRLRDAVNKSKGILDGIYTMVFIQYNKCLEIVFPRLGYNFLLKKVNRENPFSNGFAWVNASSGWGVAGKVLKTQVP